MHKLRIGVIGCGAIAQDMHLPLVTRLSEFEVKWVCDRDGARAQGCAARFGIREWRTDVGDCSQVDAVIVATPVGSRPSILRLARERGWHAFCEKPFASTAGEHLAMLEQAAHARLVLACGFMRRFYYTTGRARDLFELLPSAPSVQIIASDCSRIRRNPHSAGWYLTDATSSGGGFLMETGSHLIDQAMDVVRPAQLQIDSASQIKMDNIDYETNAIGHGHLSDGRQLRFSLALSRLRDLWSGIRISVGRIDLDLPLYPGAPLLLLNHETGSKTKIETPLSLDHDLRNAHILQIVQFAKRVQSGDFQSNPRETGLLTTQIITQCYERSLERPAIRKAS